MFSVKQAFFNEYMRRIWNNQDLSLVHESFDANAIIHSATGDGRGPQVLVNSIREWLQGFPDIKLTVLRVFEEEDKVALQWSARGSHNGYFMGIPPTNMLIQCSGVSIYRHSNNKVVEYWAYVNLYQLLDQLRSSANHDLQLALI